MNCLYITKSNKRLARSTKKCAAEAVCPKIGTNCLKTSAFTLPEVLVSMVILGIAFIGAYSGITCWLLLTHRIADYTSGMALVEAKINDIRATDYPGTNGVFSSTSTTTNSNTITVDLNKGGTTLMVPGTLTSVIQPIPGGHLVTVTLVIKETSKKYITNSLQTVVNKYSGGRGNS